MKALKVILSIVLIIGALWMLLGLFAKKDYHIERSAEINAPREVVFEQLLLFKNFKNWSPWHVYDPDMQWTITGTDGEPGAVYSWVGNDEVGKGSITLKTVAPERLDFEIKYSDWGTSPAHFILEEKGEKTNVTWAMDMHVIFPWNAFSMLTDVNAFVGKDFDNGLLNLKKVCEQIAHPKYRGFVVTETDIPVRYYVGIRDLVDTADIPAYYEETLSKVMRILTDERLSPTGPPAGLFWTWGDQVDMAIAVPVGVDKKINDTQTYPIGGAALEIEYFGPRTNSVEAHLAMDDYMAEKQLRSIPPAIEEYVTNPTIEPDTSKWLTRIIYFAVPLDSTAVEKE